MGMFDYVTADDERIVCSEGHRIRQLQTKDLNCTLARVEIADGVVAAHPSFLGVVEPAVHPLTDTIEIYGDCDECPCFVQAGTANLVQVWCEFDVRVVADRIESVTRTSASTAEFLADRPPWLEGAFGPMSLADAQVQRESMWAAMRAARKTVP